MKIFNVCIALCSIWLLGSPKTWACGGYEDPASYNFFHCTPSVATSEENAREETALFWAGVLHQNVSDELREAIQDLSQSSFNEEEYPNALVQGLKDIGRHDALQYLRLSQTLYDLQTCNRGWDYRVVTRQDYLNVLTQLDTLHTREDLIPRCQYLRLSARFAMGDDEAALRLWTDTLSLLPPSALRARAEGYLAGIYVRQGQYDKALPIYYALGDRQSLNYVVRKMLASNSLEATYQADPNAPILAYYLEDYANYFYHAFYQEGWQDEPEANPIWNAVIKQEKATEAFAARVVKEGKVRDVQMWQAFIGFLQLTKGDDASAYKSLQRAIRLKGNSTVQPLLRHYLFAAALKQKKKPAHFAQYVADEVAYYKEHRYNETEDQVLYDLYQVELPSRIMDYMTACHDSVTSFLMATVLDASAQWRLDRSLPLSTLHELYARLLHDSHAVSDGLSVAFLLQYSPVTPDEVAEHIGTRLLRMGQYTEAITWLDKVSDSYLRTMAITPYLLNRSLPRDLFTHHVTCDEDTAKAPFHPVKKEFAAQLLKLKKEIALTTDDEQKASLALKMAGWLFQASPAGDCWAISEYYRSGCDLHRNELNEEAIHYLRLALQLTHQYDTQVTCYEGLAAIPCAPNINDGYPLSYDYELKQWIFHPKDTQREAYQWFKKQKDRSHSLFSTCDWLRLYISN